jgi:hypothetical protein
MKNIFAASATLNNSLKATVGSTLFFHFCVENVIVVIPGNRIFKFGQFGIVELL